MKKRILWMLTAILLCGLTTTVFTSCGSDDDSSAVDMYQYDITIHFVRAGGISDVPAELTQAYVEGLYTGVVYKYAPEGKSKTDVSDQIKKGCQEVTSTLKEKYGKFLTGTEVTIKKQYMRTISAVDSYKF